MAEFQPCYIGSEKGESCHKTSLTKSIGFKEILDLDDSERELLLLRSGCKFIKGSICHHHFYFYLVRYESFQRVCCNPFQNHKRPVKSSLRSISMSLRNQCATIPLELVPGQKICRNCRKAISKLLMSGESEDSLEDTTADKDILALEQSYSEETNRSDLSVCFSSLGMSPIKVHSLPDATKLKTGKRKLETAITALAGKVAKSLYVPETALEPVEMQEEQNEALEKAAAFDQMMVAIQQKVHLATSYREKIQILTLCPTNWTIKKSAQFFSASEYAIRAARKLAREKGILSLPDRRHGKEIQDDVLEQVHEFYQDDEFSRIMPGKKRFRQHWKKQACPKAPYSLQP